MAVVVWCSDMHAGGIYIIIFIYNYIYIYIRASPSTRSASGVHASWCMSIYKPSAKVALMTSACSGVCNVCARVCVWVRVCVCVWVRVQCVLHVCVCVLYVHLRSLSWHSFLLILYNDIVIQFNEGRGVVCKRYSIRSLRGFCTFRVHVYGLTVKIRRIFFAAQNKVYVSYMHGTYWSQSSCRWWFVCSRANYVGIGGIENARRAKKKEVPSRAWNKTHHHAQ